MSTTPATDTTLMESMRRSSIAQLLEAAPSMLTSSDSVRPVGDGNVSLARVPDIPAAGRRLPQHDWPKIRPAYAGRREPTRCAGGIYVSTTVPRVYGEKIR